MKNRSQNRVVFNIQDFNTFSAEFIKKRLVKVTKKGPINIALSGGSTPLPILNLLKDFDLKWDKFNFFLVDERVVSINSKKSNYKNIKDAFYKYIPSKTFPIILEDKSLDEMVLAYKNNIKNHVVFNTQGQPKFDVVILGMGEDGHTASLFPNTKALTEHEEFVVKNYIPQLDSYRVTLTFPALLNCEEIIVLIKGEKKIKVFEEIINDKDKKYPISRLVGSKLKWIIGE